MGVSIIISVLVFLSLIIFWIVKEDLDFATFFGSLAFGVLIFLILSLSLQYRLKKVEWQIVKYEIRYNDVNSKYFSVIKDSHLEIYENNGNTMKKQNNYELVFEDDIAIHVDYLKEKKSTFWRRGNSKEKSENIISLNVLNKWWEQRLKELKEK